MLKQIRKDVEFCRGNEGVADVFVRPVGQRGTAIGRCKQFLQGTTGAELEPPENFDKIR